MKSGGHAAFAGASSIQDGILINLANLNTVALSSDRTVTQVGPGNNWYDVYQKLDPLGVSVVGGREAGVGVGGLLLGGESVVPRSYVSADHWKAEYRTFLADTVGVVITS